MGHFSKLFGVRVLCSKYNLVTSQNLKIKHVRGYSSLSSGIVKDNKNITTYQPITEYYSGKSVFITGGTGFLGKVYLEKLLYSCNKLDKIYLLVREKRGENVNKRIEDLFANPLFSRLKESNPDYIKKVVPVTGDVALPNLGLSSKDEQTLIDKVSVVYHAAATVKFNEPLAVAMNINFEGTQKILELSQRMKNLEALVYISTAFSQSQRNVLMETVYPPPAQVDDVYKFIEEYGHDNKETVKFLSDKGKPNTYTLTKALAESYVANNHGNVPTVIIRPSVVASTKDEPLKGWVGNWFGGTHLLFNTAKGWNRLHLGSGSNTVDFIPVDYVANLSIIAAAKAKRSKDVQVFNSTTTSENPVMWSDVYKYFGWEMISRGKNDLPYPTTFFAKSKSVIDIGTFFLQTTPAHIADLLLRIIGKEPKYARLIHEIVTTRNALNYFFSRPWMMRAERVRELYSSLSSEDKQTFPCDPTQIEWSEYFRDYCKGVQKYLKPRYTV